jgi:hypothetical protein
MLWATVFEGCNPFSLRQFIVARTPVTSVQCNLRSSENLPVDLGPELER